MFSSAVLETGLGLGFVYLLFSLVCTSLAEGIARLLRLRASTLKSAIANMVGGEERSASDLELVQALYEHNAIRSLAKPSVYDQVIGFPQSKWEWTRSLLFRLICVFMGVLSIADAALIGVVSAEISVTFGWSQQVVQLIMMVAGIALVIAGSKFDAIGRPSYLPPHAFAIALLDVAKTNSKDKARLESIINRLPSSVMKESMKVAADDLQSQNPEVSQLLVEQLEQWFQDVMDRANGWYTRKIRSLVMILAIIVTIAFNLDTMAIVNTLSQDANTRGAIAAAAVDYVSENSEIIESVTVSPTAPSSLTHAIRQLEEELGGAKLPIGWVTARHATSPTETLLLTPLIVSEVVSGTVQYEAAKQNRQLWEGVSIFWSSKLPGFLLTIIALSLGAPFWFDVLSKIVKLRAVGKPPT